MKHLYPLLACLLSLPALVSGEKAQAVSYYKDIRPIFQARCQGCHQPAKDKGDYSMTTFKELLAGGESGEAAVIPNQGSDSKLVKMIIPNKDGEIEMPRKRDPLHAEEVALIRKWIDAGAADDTPSNAKQLYTMEHPPVYEMPPVITSLNYSPDGKWLAVAGFHEVLLHRADGSGLEARLVGLSERIESVRFSPDGSKLAVTGGRPARMGEVQIWDVNKRSLKLSAPVTFDTVYGASWSPGGTNVAFACSDNTVRAINVNNGKEILFMGAHTDWAFDTVFTVKGDHVVSVGRDMTAKLTKVDEQRFIDNVTSITPGALKGGLMSVTRHPGKEQILFGGSDGIPKIYKIFRTQARKIGDDANHLWSLPPLPGRIFSVDWSTSAKRIAAGSSLDGQGAVHIYTIGEKYPNGEGYKVPPNILGLLSKTGRSKAEDDQIGTYFKSGIEKITRVKLDETGIYAVAFSPDEKTLAAAGSDGRIRFIDTDSGSIRKTFIPVPLPESALNKVASLSIEPTSIDLDGRFSYAQLLITAWTAAGDRIDVTRDAKIELSEPVVSLLKNGKIKAKQDGSARLSVSYEDIHATAQVRVANSQQPVRPDYIRDVTPVISKLGCNAGTCHGSKDGKNGFKLSLRGYDPIYDIRAFTDDIGARRINTAAPDSSLMLLKATAGVPHEGDQLTKPGSDYYEIVRAWIAGGAKLNLDIPRVTGIQLLPENPVVQKAGSSQQFRVIASFADGATRDVTAESFITSANGDVAEEHEGGIIASLRRGEAPVLARYEGQYAATTLTVMGDRKGFEWVDQPENNPIDGFTAAKWKRMKILPSDLCTDSDFVRRVHLDLTGLPPTPDVVKAFLADKRETKLKRDELVDQLVGSEPFIDYWTNKWADLLQVNRKFLGPEGAKNLRAWIRKEVAANTPYDEFTRSILTASGSNKEHPAASYFKVLREPDAIMENTTHLFLATRFNCNKCHDHPFERWTQDQYYELAAYFAQTGLKKDPKGGDGQIGRTAVEAGKPLFEVVFDKNDGEIKHERTGEITPPKFPYETAHQAPDKATRRQALASWMTAPDNPYFARSYVNRLWGYLNGIGIIEPIDDIRASNPPTNPELLDWLTAQFIEAKFDPRHVMKLICKSRTYQLSVTSNPYNEDDEINFSHATPRRLPAEVLYDTIYQTTGATPRIPGVPAGTRAAQLPDVGVELPDGFLGKLGRPVRESACECERVSGLELGPIMALISGPTVGNAVSDPNNAIGKLVKEQADDRKLIEELFVRILNRPATPAEVDVSLSTLELIKKDHATLDGAWKAEEEKWKPTLGPKEKAREEAIAKATTELRAYEKEIAPREKKLNEERNARIKEREAAFKEYEKKLPALQTAWEQGIEKPTQWISLEPGDMSSTMEAAFTKQEDYSIFVSGKNGKGDYEITATSPPGTITGIRLEAIPDERLPGKGSGRGGSGNFVLSEFEVFAVDAQDPKKQTKLKLFNPKASFTQGGFDVKTTINGKLDKGWAIHNQEIKRHVAIWPVKQSLELPEGTKLLFRLKQHFNDGTHSLGRFRLSVATDPVIDLKTPDNLVKFAKKPADKRDKKEKDELAKYYKTIDLSYTALLDALNEAKKPRPVDPKLTGFRNALSTAQIPLNIDPVLASLRRDIELSRRQVGQQRLTAAQDIAWALINSPAFLFNH